MMVYVVLFKVVSDNGSFRIICLMAWILIAVHNLAFVVFPDSIVLSVATM